MRCWRVDLQKDLTSYLNGALGAQRRERIECHLFDCRACRTRLESLRAVHRSLQEMPEVEPERNAEAGFWTAWRGALADRASGMTPATPAWRQWIAKPSLVAAMAGLVILQGGLLFAVRNGFSFHGHPSGASNNAMLDAGNFRAVNVEDFGKNTAPRVVTEGYARDVEMDKEEGTLRFRLVDDTGKSSSFVVCEISGPVRMNPPTEGSRVRVYGVSRYDAQEDRAWYEINPVLHIAVLHQ